MLPYITMKKDIGNLNNNNFKVELDPKKELKLVEDKDKGQQAYYKGNKINYLDYIGEVGNRIERNKKGKGVDKVGTFAGFGSGTLKKAYKEN